MNEAALAPDVGTTFTTTRVYRYRRWAWRPFPWYRKREISDVHSYRVHAWLRRRPPRPAPADEQSALVQEILDELLAEGRIDPPRGAGPDNVPLDFCLRKEAEYVEGVGVAGTIVRVSDLVITGTVDWPPETLEREREHAIRLAGQQVW